jgi:hypothetical protein
MRKKKRTSKEKAAALPEGLNKRLAAYALAAGAAGVGALALAVPAEAGIVSHSISLRIPCNSTTQLDIAGPVHLSFFDVCSPVLDSGGISLLVAAVGSSLAVAMSSGIICPCGSQGPLPARLGKGSPIGSRDRFGSGIMFRSRSSLGHWVPGFPEPSRGYLGFEFGVNSKHFGWVALSVFKIDSSNEHGVAGLIKGYAYDTIPRQAIDAGQTVPEPGTLSLLALGAAGLFALRKRKQSGVSHQ